MGIISLKEGAAFPVASEALGIMNLKFHLEMQSFLQMGSWPLSSWLTEVLHKQTFFTWMSGEPQVLQWEVETSNLALTIPVVLVSKRNSLCHSSRGRTRLCSPRSCVNREGRHPAPGNGLSTPARSSQQLFLLDRCAKITCSLLWAQIKFLTHSPLFVGS